MHKKLLICVCEKFIDLDTVRALLRGDSVRDSSLRLLFLQEDCLGGKFQLRGATEDSKTFVDCEFSYLETDEEVYLEITALKTSPILDSLP
jgi:hypothetical protein